MNQNERTTEREIKKKKNHVYFAVQFFFQESKNAFCPSRIAVFNFDFIISFVE